MLPLADKYAPKCFDEVLGQSEAVNWCREQVAEQKFGNAIFVGPTGTGKTSTARLYARYLLCSAPAVEKPCNSCDGCNGWSSDHKHEAFVELACPELGDIKNIKSIAPSIGRAAIWISRKIVFLDEVQALSPQAFDVLLKPLEKQGATVILATTELQKIPQTVSDRLETVWFKPIDVDTVVADLQRICDLEGLTAKTDALLAIARSCEGSQRRARKTLGQVAAAGCTTISSSDVARATNTIASIQVGEVLLAMLHGDGQQVIDGLKAWHVSAEEKADAIQRLLAFIFQTRVRGRRVDDLLCLAVDKETRAKAFEAIEAKAQVLYPDVDKITVWQNLVQLWDPRPAETDSSLRARADRFTDLVGGPL